MSVQQDHPRRLASDIVRRWRQGQDADACLAMEAHPELAACRSAALELAYGEYRWRIDRGEEVQTTHFASRFPHCRTSLARRIAVDQFVSENPSRFTELPESSWPGEGDDFLNFTLLEELGRGAIGRVFLAEDHDLGRQVVVKIAPLGTQEAQTLSKLSHPNVVPVYSVEDDLEYNRVGICMPYLGRGTLEDFFDCAFGAGQGQPPRVFAEPLQRLRGTYSQQERQQLQGRRDEFLWRANYVDGILHWGRQLADALAHTHDRGVRHLDIKPSNVLLTPDGLPMLLDFNLSAVQGADSILIGGTLPYMSPEQLRATAAGPRTPEEPIDDRADIFSLGVILYELLAGEHPFGPISWKNRSEQVLLELSRRHQQGARPVNQVNRQVDRRSAALIGRCLSADPRQRPPTAARLRDELDRCLTAPRRWHRYARGRPWTSLLTLLALMLLVGGLVALLALRPARHERSYWSGLQMYEQGRYGEAERAFTDAIDHHRDHFASHFARGQTRLQLQDYTGAISDFDWCHQNEPHPILVVSSAYACELAGQHDRAMLRYFNLQRANYQSFAFLNNAGYAYSQSGQLDTAGQYLTNAVQLDRTSAIGRFNRAKNYLRISDRMRAPVPRNAVDDVEFAIASGLRTKTSYFIAASIYRQSDLDDETRVNRALNYLRSAVKLGLKLEAYRAFQRDPSFASRPELNDIMRMKVNTVENFPPHPYLIKPCGDRPILDVSH